MAERSAARSFWALFEYPRQAAELVLPLFDQRQVVVRRAGVRHDRARHELAQRLDGVAPVLVDVDDDVCRPELAQPGQVDILRSADLRHVANHVAGLDAETGARDQPRLQSEHDHRFGQARHQTGYPHGSDPPASCRRPAWPRHRQYATAMRHAADRSAPALEAHARSNPGDRHPRPRRAAPAVRPVQRCNPGP